MSDGHAERLAPDEDGPLTASKVEIGRRVVVLRAGVAPEIIETGAVLAARLVGGLQSKVL